MEFQFSREEEQFRAEIREFVKAHIPPERYGHKYEEEHDDEAWEFALSISEKLAEKKWLTISWPEEYGGMGASLWKQAIFKEETGYWGIPGTTMGISGTSWVGPSLILFGTEEQKQKYLPLIAAGEPDGVWCTGYSEPDSGSDLASLQTRADKVGDGYIINGQKVWTSSAHRARWCWLACRTNSNVEKKHHGLSLMIVDMKSEGVTVRPLKSLAGLHLFNELYFNDVKVPASNLVGVENNGWSQLMKALSFERGTSITYSGIHRRLLDELRVYTRETGLFKKPQIRQRLADLYTEVECLKLLAYESVWKANAGLAIVHEPSRDKAYSDLLHEKVSRTGLDILEAYGMMDPVQKQSRWTKLKGLFEHLYFVSTGMAIAAGTTYTQRNIVGQLGLHLPRSY